MSAYFDARFRRAAGLASVVFSSVLVAALSTTGCGGEPEEDTTTGGTTTGATCALGERALEDGRCQPPGLPLDMECPPGEAPLGDGGCQPAGVPPELCGDGFEANGERGCRPILPEGPCPEGQMAIPGETECHEVTPCGTGTWGDIVIEEDTQFVDNSYPGLDSDGTKGKPWKTIQDGLDAAAAGAVVAVAAGTYEEDVSLSFEPKRLWGRCPALVTIRGVSPEGAAVAVLSSGSELHDLAITGPSTGVSVTGPGDFLIEGVRLHDSIGGVSAEGGAAVTVRGSLFERIVDFGLESRGSSLTVEDTAVRDVRELGDGPRRGTGGYGVAGELEGAARAAVTVRSSLLERIETAAINAWDADLIVEGAAVRSPVLPPELDIGGRGIEALRANVTLRGSTFEDMYGPGILLFASRASIERVTVAARAPLPPSVVRAEGILVLKTPYASPSRADIPPSRADIRQSTVAGGVGPAILVKGSAASIESVLIRERGQTLADGRRLAAIVVEDSLGTILRYSVIEDCESEGMWISGTDVLFERSVIRDMRVDVDPPVSNVTGRGICAGVQPGFVPPYRAGTLTLRSSLLEHCIHAGAIAANSRLVAESSIVRDVLPNANDGRYGDGILVAASDERAGAELLGTRVESVARAGVVSFGAPIGIGFSSVSCTSFDLAGQGYLGLPFSFDKLGDNACGCPEAGELCQVQSPGLDPPENLSN
jgi:hypothetical protein